MWLNIVKGHKDGYQIRIFAFSPSSCLKDSFWLLWCLLCSIESSEWKQNAVIYFWNLELNDSMVANYPTPLEQDWSRWSWLANFLARARADNQLTNEDWLLQLMSMELDVPKSTEEGFWWHHPVAPENRTLKSWRCQWAEFVDDIQHPMD